MRRGLKGHLVQSFYFPEGKLRLRKVKLIAPGPTAGKWPGSPSLRYGFPLTQLKLAPEPPKQFTLTLMEMMGMQEGSMNRKPLSYY